MCTHRSHRHEHGQNFLVDRSVIRTIVDLVTPTNGPIIEIGAGDGALTLPLQELGRPLVCVEIDGRYATRLARRTGPATAVVHADFLEFGVPITPHVLVGNLPFHQTTAILRRILDSPGWTESVLLVQWEVARRRAGVGGATMMTAQWWPWFHFTLVGRVPATAFRPRPTVDGGLMTMTRRAQPLVAHADRQRHHELVRRVFTGSGRGLTEIVAAAAPDLPRRRIQRWMRQHHLTGSTQPRHLTASQWADLSALRQSAPDRGTPRPAGARR